jgi:hypothetical protein
MVRFGCALAFDIGLVAFVAEIAFQLLVAAATGTRFVLGHFRVSFNIKSQTGAISYQNPYLTSLTSAE